MVGHRRIERRCRIAVAAAEQARIVYPDIAALNTPARLSLASVLFPAHIDSEQTPD